MIMEKMKFIKNGTIILLIVYPMIRNLNEL